MFCQCQSIKEVKGSEIICQLIVRLSVRPMEIFFFNFWQKNLNFLILNSNFEEVIRTSANVKIATWDFLVISY